MKTGIEFREGISGTGGTSIRLSSKMSMKKKIIVRISNHKKIQSLEELGSMKKIQGTQIWNHNVIGLRADSGI